MTRRVDLPCRTDLKSLTKLLNSSACFQPRALNQFVLPSRYPLRWERVERNEYCRETSQPPMTLLSAFYGWI